MSIQLVRSGYVPCGGLSESFEEFAYYVLSVCLNRRFCFGLAFYQRSSSTLNNSIITAL